MATDQTLVRADTARGSEFAGLLGQVRSAGLLDRRPGYYAVKIASTALALVAAAAVFVMLGDSWWQLALAAFLAVVFAQFGFIGHDAGHGQIRSGARANALIGVLHANALIGLSYGCWIDKHNRHHAHPNDPGRDVDVDAGALALTVQAAAGRRGLGRTLVRYQAWHFLPLRASPVPEHAARELETRPARGAGTLRPDRSALPRMRPALLLSPGPATPRHNGRRRLPCGRRVRLSGSGGAHPLLAGGRTFNRAALRFRYEE